MNKDQKRALLGLSIIILLLILLLILLFTPQPCAERKFKIVFFLPSGQKLEEVVYVKSETTPRVMLLGRSNEAVLCSFRTSMVGFSLLIREKQIPFVFERMESVEIEK